MSAHVNLLFSLLNELRKRDKMRGYASRAFYRFFGTRLINDNSGA